MSPSPSSPTQVTGGKAITSTDKSDREQIHTSLNHSLANIASLPSSQTDDAANALLQLSIALVDSAIDILTEAIKSDDQLTHVSVLMPGGTLGKHFRHVIETYRAFLAPINIRSGGLDENALEMDYDKASSGRKYIAKSIDSCRKALEEVKGDLIAWGRRCESGHDNEQGERLAEEMGREVLLVAITPTKQRMASSVGRELWFCSLHAIHHFSMIRAIAVHELGLSLPVEFGTAPSTLLYRRTNWQPPQEKKEVRVVKSKL